MKRIEDLKNILESNVKNDGKEVTRRSRKMKELSSFKISITEPIITQLMSYNYRQNEYNQYLEMIIPQINRFKNYYKLDLFSRRLIIQFPANWYENKNIEYMPCPESFLVSYTTQKTFDLIINMRSSEVHRVLEDLSIILNFCFKELNIQGTIEKLHVHFMNLHMYLEGTSEDFNASSSYFSMKTA